ncbi:MAG: tetratricopeptide repeat protein, partial [Chloroflexota bacterium]|nr:tetratricopeptide repeat protein [Chloroflexota bacterium]
MSSGHDFNHKVALASGLRSLQSGRLRQAEEQFRYLVSKFPHHDGGYRGLAKVLVRLDDHAAALETLRAGAPALAKAGERQGAITLLREAVQLAPCDLSAHRRLGAALALAGENDAAVVEYRRFIDEAVAAGDVERAKLEARYAREMLPASRDLTSLRDAAQG